MVPTAHFAPAYQLFMWDLFALALILLAFFACVCLDIGGAMNRNFGSGTTSSSSGGSSGAGFVKGGGFQKQVELWLDADPYRGLSRKEANLMEYDYW